MQYTVLIIANLYKFQRRKHKSKIYISLFTRDAIYVIRQMAQT